jgi:GxxExxY protein
MEDGPVLEEQQLSYIIRGSVYEVFKCLGCGFLENVYENALLLELKSRGLYVISQAPVKVNYKDTIVGNNIADILVEDRILLELKAQRQLNQAHEAQLLNYLKATGLRVGLLINFSYPRATIKRLVV